MFQHYVILLFSPSDHRARLRRLRVLVDSGAEIDRRHKAICRDLSLCNSDTRAGDALMCATHIVYLRYALVRANQ